MNRTQDIQDTSCLGGGWQRGGTRLGLLVLVVLLICSPPAHAVGPYTAESGTVVDQGTGLEWQHSDACTSCNWQEALASCEMWSLDSKTDWRLPNIRELKSIVDYSRYYPAADHVFAFQSSVYWSSTTVADSPTTSAWTVFLGNGDDTWDDKAKSYAVRCVRAGLSGQHKR